MSRPESLDALLQKIQTSSSMNAPEALHLEAEVGDKSSEISAELKAEDVEPVASSSDIAFADTAHTIVALSEQLPENKSSVLQESDGLWENRLTPRQRLLPKISVQMISGIAAIMVMMAGVGAATMLSQSNQDLRQQAYEDTTGEITGPAASLTQEQLDAQSSSIPSTPESGWSLDGILTREWSLVELVVLAAAGVSIIILLAFLLWILQD